MVTSATLACFAFVLLAMNFATYFAREESTLQEEIKAMCRNKAMKEASDFCFKEIASPLMKELNSFCFEKVGIKGEFSMKSMYDASCVKGGAKTFYQVNECVKKELSEREISQEIYLKQQKPYVKCVGEELAGKKK